MARTFHVLFLPSVSLTDAPAAEADIAQALQSLGLLSPCCDERIDALGRQVRRYPIAETAAKLFRKSVPDEFGLGDYAESFVGRYANGWSVNLTERYDCPLCAATLQAGTDSKRFDKILQEIQYAVVEFIDTGKVPSVRCPSCTKDAVAAKWKTDVPPAMAHLAFEFAQFPPFNSSAVSIPAALFGYGEWLVDVPLVIQTAVSQPVEWSMGRI
jgi:hypothetical protein